jgi:hypothetical protein
MTRIGVSGHRNIREQSGLKVALKAALAEIETVYSQKPEVIISPLAEGADQIVARMCMEEYGIHLVAVLPVPRDDYVQDFKRESSRETFLRLSAAAWQTVQIPPQPSRDQAYATAGRYVVDHCDVLIALWDGEPALGRGGTGEIVTYAREQNRPLVWIVTGHADGGQERGTDREVDIRYERLHESLSGE